MRSLAALFGVFAAVAMAGGCSTVLGLDDLRDRSADGVLDSGPDDAGSGERGRPRARRGAHQQVPRPHEAEVTVRERRLSVGARRGVLRRTGRLLRDRSSRRIR